MGNENKMWFRLDESLRDGFDALVKDHEGNISRAVNVVIERALVPAAPPETLGEVTLAEAAAAFLRHIPQGQAELIVDLCADTDRTPQDYILSYIALAYERGETPTLLGEHLRAEEPVGGAVKAPVTAEVGRTKPCDYCKQPFTVEHRGQRFCPDPDDGTPSCGRRAHLEYLHSRRPQAKRGAVPGHDYSPPQQDVTAVQRAVQLARG